MVGPTEAEDALQEAWLRAARSLDRFDGRSTLRTWLTGIALNCAREGRRSRGGPAPAETDAPTAPPSGPASGDLRLDLERAVDALPEGYRLVLVLHDLWGHGHAEIAAMLGIAEATSRSQLARARRLIRQRLEG